MENKRSASLNLTRRCRQDSDEVRPDRNGHLATRSEPKGLPFASATREESYSKARATRG